MKNIVMDEIHAFAIEKELIYGVCDGDPLENAEKFARFQVPFVSYGFEERTQPEKTLNGVKSIIVIGRFYAAAGRPPNDALRCALSAGMAGEDYHGAVKSLMAELETRISRKAAFRSAKFADNGPLMERALAVKAGLGFFGKNSAVINPERGSFFTIGYIMTDLRLPASHAETAGFAFCEKTCGNNPLCEKMCPGNALDSRKKPVLDFTKCVSYLTQKKGTLNEREAQAIGSRLMGCDVCQSVCPYNKRAATAESEFFPLIADILKMTNADFNLRFKRTAAGWRGKKTLMRNALIALSNVGGESGLIEPFLTHEDDMLRNTAIYAFKRLNFQCRKQ